VAIKPQTTWPRPTIVSIDLETLEAQDAIPNFHRAFASECRGKHQLLPHGNRLITIPEQGRAIEVAPDGGVAIEFGNVSVNNAGSNENPVNAKWPPEGFFTTQPSCSN
jgi:hypothetical protein